MYWNAWSSPPSKGLTETIAISRATMATILPTETSLFSVAPGFITFLYMSIVKMAAVLFNILARDDTIAATRAAHARPFMPVGAKFLNNHGYALSAVVIVPESPSASPGFLNSTYAAIPGMTTMTGMRILRYPAKRRPFFAS